MPKPPPDGGPSQPTLNIVIAEPAAWIAADPPVAPITVSGTAWLSCDNPAGCTDGSISGVDIQFGTVALGRATFTDTTSWTFTGTPPDDVINDALVLEITATVTASIASDKNQTTDQTATATTTVWLRRAGLPSTRILDTSFDNPPYNYHVDPNHPDWDWAKTVAGGRRWLADDPPPRFEWTPILDPSNQFDDKVAGCAGWVLAERESANDVPFTHPFGFDWTLDMVVDAAYQPLVAPQNQNAVTDDVKAALDALGLPDPNPSLMHVEMDQGLIPERFRSQAGDRVAVFGRWIVDCGHDPYTTEIHPPLLFATARGLSAETTHSTLVGRPFLVNQEFDGDSLRPHLIQEVARIEGEGVVLPPFWDHVKAKPVAFNTFSSMHLVHYWVRPSAPRLTANDELIATFHFTTRTGITVQLVNDTENDAIGVWLVMNDTAYVPPPLPATTERNWRVDQLELADHEAADAIGIILDVSSLNPAAYAILQEGVLTDEYAHPEATSAHDTEVVTVPASQLGSVQPFSVDDSQPFPVYGWLDVTWQRGQPSEQITTDAALGAGAAGNTTVLVAKSPDGRIFYTYWQLGQGGQGWKELDGGGRTDAAPAAALVGTYLFVAVKGLDGTVYLNQGELGQAFVGWQRIN